MFHWFTLVILTFEIWNSRIAAQISTSTGMHVLSGTLQSGISTAASCISTCSSTSGCRALDFNSDGNTCWFHFDASVCNPLRAKSSCTHYKFVTCDTSRHIIGGTFQVNFRTVTDCINGCIAEPSCLAVDFNSADNSCWFHSGTACNTLQVKASCNHYKTISCTSSPGAPAPVATAFLTETHILGGTLQTGINTLADCTNACSNSATCQALDFDCNGNTCWFHFVATSCNTLMSLATSTHIKFVTCANTPVSSPITGIVQCPAPAPVVPAPVVPAPVVPAPVVPAPVVPAPVSTPASVTGI